MGATVVIRREEDDRDNDLIWMPNNHWYRITLQQIIKFIDASNPLLAQELTEYIHAFPYINMTQWSAEKLRTLWDSVVRIEDEVIAQYVSLASPSVRLRVINSLKIQLSFDERLSEIAYGSRTGKVTLSNNQTWVTSERIYDLVLCDILWDVSTIISQKNISNRHKLMESIAKAKDDLLFDLSDCTIDEYDIIAMSMTGLWRTYKHPGNVDLFPMRMRANILSDAIELCNAYKKSFPNVLLDF